MPRTLAALAVALPLVSSLAAQQQASAYLPLNHWTMPYVEFLIARGDVADPTPMTRPLRRADVVQVLGAVDTTRSASLAATVRSLLAAVAEPDADQAGVAELYGGGFAATHARRDPLREAGSGHGVPVAGAALAARLGPVAASVHPYLDTRLKYDPDYRGKKDRAIAGRVQEAYGVVQTKYVDAFFGLIDRNWGMPAFEGLAVSPSPYSYDHFGLRLGTRRVRLDAVWAQLDNLPDATGADAHRYYVAHRFYVQPVDAIAVALWEGTIVAGPSRGLDQWFANVFNLGLLAQYDQGTNANHQLGFDLRVAPDRWPALYGSFMLDDVQVDTEGAGDNEPMSYGLLLGIDGRAPARGRWRATYTRVSNLAYRTPNPAEAVMRRNVGLARNFSDYEQFMLQGEWLVLPGVLLRPEATLLRQGEGDFRLPYPPVEEYAQTPTIFAGVVEQTIRGAVSGDVAFAFGVTARFDAGVHFVTDVGHSTGASDTRFVASIEAIYRFRVSGALP